MLHAARCKCRTQKSRQKSPSGHHPTTLSGYIFANKACIDNRKNLLSSNISSTCPHNMVNFGPLAAEIVSLVWGTPANFNWFCVFHLCSTGRPSRWALAHILVYYNSHLLPGSRYFFANSTHRRKWLEFCRTLRRIQKNWLGQGVGSTGRGVWGDG